MTKTIDQRVIDAVLVLFDKNGATYDVYYYLSSRRSLGYFGGVGKDPLWTVEPLVNETGKGR